MKKLLYCTVFAAAFCTTMSSLKADEVDLARVLGHGQTCDHVIRLVLQHGVNNEVDHSGHNQLHQSRFGPMLIPGNEIGDLELIQVTSLPHADPACGPKFAIVIRNNSTREVCGPRISAVALLGRIRSTSPTSIVKVDKICAGESIEINVQLPIEALSMGNHNGTVCGFRRLLVAIDSFDQFVESNESNNIKVFDSASIPIATVVPAAVSQTSAINQVVGQANGQSDDAAAETGQAVGQSVAQPAPTPATGPSASPAKDDLQSAMQKLSDASTSVQPASATL